MEENKGTSIDDRRGFQDPVTDVTYYLNTPTADDVRGADWQYSKTYTKSLVEGITTSAEMLDILMRRGINGPEFEQRQKELTDELATKVALLREASSIEAKQDLAIDVAKSREELFNWNQRLNGPMANTCEQMADDSRLEYLTSRMVQDESGKRIWDEYADFLTEKNQSLAMRARFEVMLYLQGLESDFLEKTPEAQAIKEIEQEIQEKADEALAELEKAATAEASEEMVAEASPVKPTVRKKRGRKPAKKKSSE